MGSRVLDLVDDLGTELTLQERGAVEALGVGIEVVGVGVGICLGQPALARPVDLAGLAGLLDRPAGSGDRLGAGRCRLRGGRCVVRWGIARRLGVSRPRGRRLR